MSIQESMLELESSYHPIHAKQLPGVLPAPAPTSRILSPMNPSSPPRPVPGRPGTKLESLFKEPTLTQLTPRVKFGYTHVVNITRGYKEALDAYKVDRGQHGARDRLRNAGTLLKTVEAQRHYLAPQSRDVLDNFLSSLSTSTAAWGPSSTYTTTLTAPSRRELHVRRLPSHRGASRQRQAQLSGGPEKCLRMQSADKGDPSLFITTSRLPNALSLSTVMPKMESTTASDNRIAHPIVHFRTRRGNEASSTSKENNIPTVEAETSETIHFHKARHPESSHMLVKCYTPQLPRRPRMHDPIACREEMNVLYLRADKLERSEQRLKVQLAKAKEARKDALVDLEETRTQLLFAEEKLDSREISLEVYKSRAEQYRGWWLNEYYSLKVLSHLVPRPDDIGPIMDSAHARFTMYSDSVE
ncbi:hypothetical protein DFP72DRAFT_843030 [Ephemerocybe angulata]|uniref:Uncharacterized protein n=1 Tax=Ephemerocybe angulata TaxID=980116 RepID=A0A8H6IBD7_9AGAR|nr:hypothetical protein DFP72DRAFT_843030 [Tulosesus angulatus]